MKAFSAGDGLLMPIIHSLSDDAEKLVSTGQCEAGSEKLAAFGLEGRVDKELHAVGANADQLVKVCVGFYTHPRELQRHGERTVRPIVTSDGLFGGRRGTDVHPPSTGDAGDFHFHPAGGKEADGPALAGDIGGARQEQIKRAIQCWECPLPFQRNGVFPFDGALQTHGDDFEFTGVNLAGFNHAGISDIGTFETQQRRLGGNQQAEVVAFARRGGVFQLAGTEESPVHHADFMGHGGREGLVGIAGSHFGRPGEFYRSQLPQRNRPRPAAGDGVAVQDAIDPRDLQFQIVLG